ncbi:PilW family protein [Deinococcus oregonensis]|uniref:PilW family protein n=1 Tax=Deinococcus oregonensis TaxID=1805970 RepID=A0ABV6B099_9DEIO
MSVYSSAGRAVKGQADGFTLVELLVVMALSGIIMTALLGMVFSAQKLYQNDTARAAVNQDISVALNSLSNDGRQAGERMTSDFVALTVTGDPLSRVLTLRRGLLDVVLPVCKEVKAGTNTDVVFVSKNGGGSGSFPANCKDDSNESGLGIWKAYRLAQGGSVNAYIYNPKTKIGETFTYDAEDGSGQHLHKSSGKWLNDYPTEDEPRVYMLEELKYFLQANVLYLAENGGVAQPFLPNVVSFEADPYIKGALGVSTKVSTDFPLGTQTWKDLQQLNVKITATAKAGTKTVQRDYSSSFTPRNVFSADY